MVEYEWTEFDEKARLFLDILRRSELVEESKLDAVLLNLNPRHCAPDDLLSLLTSTLVERQLLTPCQVEKLLQKKFKGFIAGDFVITDQIESNSDFARFLAYERNTRRAARLKIPPRSKWLSEQIPYKIEEIE